MDKAAMFTNRNLVNILLKIFEANIIKAKMNKHYF